MLKLAAALLTVCLLEAAHSSLPPATIHDKFIRHFQTGERMETRQDECTFPSSYPEECLTVATNVATQFSTADPENVNSDMLNQALDELCTSECIGPQVEYYECLGQQDIADFFNSAYCGQSSDSYCLVLWLDGVIENAFVAAPLCTQGGTTCDSDCQSTVQNTVDFLGCCATSLYDNSYSPFYVLITPQDFAACDITLGQMCAGPASGVGVNSVTLGQLTIFAAVATLVSAIF